MKECILMLLGDLCFNWPNRFPVAVQVLKLLVRRASTKFIYRSLYLSCSYLRMVDVFIDLGTAGENVKRVKRYTFLRKHATGSATTELHIVHVERGMSWEDAMDRWSELEGAKEGFYLSHQV